MAKQSSLLHFVVRGRGQTNEQEKAISERFHPGETKQSDIKKVSKTFSLVALESSATPDTLPCQGTLIIKAKVNAQDNEHKRIVVYRSLIFVHISSQLWPEAAVRMSVPHQICWL